MKLRVDLGSQSYDVVLKRGSLGRLHRLAALHRRVLVVSDAGVPAAYVKALLDQCAGAGGVAGQVVLAPGQGKTTAGWQAVAGGMLAAGLGRGDAVVALGGGAVCGTAAFAAATYLGGVDCIWVPTTAMAQLGALNMRAALDLEGAPDRLWVPCRPQLVLIDPDTLATLPPRQRKAGLVAALQTALACSRELFDLLEAEEITEENLERVLALCLLAQKELAERDQAGGPGRLLSLGQPLARAVRAACGPAGPPYGECLALGLLPVVESRTLLRRTRAVLRKWGLPLKLPCAAGEVLRLAEADELREEDGCYTLVRVKQPGQAYLERVEPGELRLMVEGMA